MLNRVDVVARALRTHAPPARLTLLLLVLAVMLGCQRGIDEQDSRTAGHAWFEDVAAKVGIDYVNDPGPMGSYFMPQSMGNGAAFLDFDQDGRLDILLLQGAGPRSTAKNRLYHQQPDGQFRDVSEGSGLDIAAFGSGVAVGDVNNDGLPDVFLSEFGGLRLFLNAGQGRFRDITDRAGLNSVYWGTSASFLDYDRDGWLDLVVANYVAYDSAKLCLARDGSRDFCGPTQFSGTVALLYHNVSGTSGGEARFEDVTKASGFAELKGPGLGVLCADFDGDDWDDILIANDQHPNHLWINRHDGTFRDEAVSRGVAVNSLGRPEANMGTAWGDANGDGLFDLFVTHIDRETHTLWSQEPRGLFMDQTAGAGLASLRRSTGFGAVFADFDLDGDLDLAFTNGRVLRGQEAAAPNLPSFWQPYAQPNDLLENDGTGKFKSVAGDNPALCGQANVARPLCCGDFDNDGDLDLLIGRTSQSALLLRNTAARRGHWLRVRAVDPQLRRDAYGAVVTVSAGERKWQRLVNPGSSYLSSHDSRVHFGLGPAASYSGISVRWPDGTTEFFSGGDADQFVEVRRGGGRSG